MKPKINLRWLIRQKRVQPYGQWKSEKTLQIEVNDGEAYAAMHYMERSKINKYNFPTKWVDIPTVLEEENEPKPDDRRPAKRNKGSKGT